MAAQSWTHQRSQEVHGHGGQCSATHVLCGEEAVSAADDEVLAQQARPELPPGLGQRRQVGGEGAAAAPGVDGGHGGVEQVVHLPAQQQHRLWRLSFRSGQILTTVLGKHVLIRSQKSIMMNHQCPDCDYRTSQSCHLRRHINSIHRKKERLPKCPECKITFSLKEGLQQHIESVHRGKRFQCPECETTFSSFGNHQRHIKSVHRGKRFQCPECDYEASQSTN